jgi:hypothetical protein
MMQSRTLFYGIGAQKAATTWLHDQLSRLDEVRLPREKEVHYWDTWRGPAFERYRMRAARDVSRYETKGGKRLLSTMIVPKLARRHAEAVARRDLLTHFDASHARYLRHLHRDAGPGDVVGDITPAYAVLPTASFAQMYGAHPNARFVFILRDPLDRLLSGIGQKTYKRIAAGQLDAEAARAMQAAAFSDALTEPGNGDFLRSDYRRTFEALDQSVPVDRVFVMFYETMFNEKTMADLGAFLGLRYFAPVFGKKVHTAPVERYRPSEDERATARELLEPVYAFVRDRFAGRVPDAWDRAA